MIKAVAAYQPAKQAPDKQDIVRLQQQPIQAINELLKRVQSIESPEAWHAVGEGGEPEFESSWENYSVSYNSCAFRKTSSGLVHLRGIVKNGTAPNAVIFRLPVGCRPVRVNFTAGASSTANGVDVQIDVDGDVRFSSGGSVVWSSLDGVSFWVD